MERQRPTPLLIFPYNGNGREALDCLGDTYRLVAFVDDTQDKHGVTDSGHPVGGRSLMSRYPSAAVLAVPGSPSSYPERPKIIDGLGVPMDLFATVVHPTARISPLARVGRNVLIMAGVVVTSNAVIGDHVCVLPNTVIHHDVSIGAYTLIGSNASISGGTSVGVNCYIGSGSSLINGMSVGDRALIGLASTVLYDVAAESCVAGNPARNIARRKRLPGNTR